MRKDLTLLITLFDPLKIEISYWCEAYFLLKEEGFEVHFISDNPYLIKDSFEVIDNNDWFPTEKNVSKFQRVIDHIDGGHVKTRFFKTVDPDDQISITELNKINFPKQDNILRTKYKKLSTFLEKQIEVERNFIKSPNKIKRTFSTSVTILPTIPIYKRSDKKFLKRQFINLFEDQLLALICLSEGSKVIDYDISFYYYAENNGLSSFENVIKNCAEYEYVFDCFLYIVKKYNIIPDTITFDWHAKKMPEIMKITKGTRKNKKVIKKCNRNYLKQIRNIKKI